VAFCISLPLFQGKSRKKVYTVLMKQNHIIVLDMWEINVGKKGNTQNLSFSEKGFTQTAWC